MNVSPPEIKVESWGDDPKGDFERLLCNCGVLVLVDSAASGVVLPKHLTGKIMLDYDLDAIVPIPDLEATNQGVSATLSFSREPHKTFVPWTAVIVMAPKRTGVTSSRTRVSEGPEGPGWERRLKLA
jgi:hypothetical protein